MKEMTPEDLPNSAVKIIKEVEFINASQTMVDYGNSNVYSNFKMKLEIEPVTEEEDKAKE